MPSYSYKKGTFSNVYSNTVELERGITTILKQAQENTLERMIDELKRIIEEDVYNKPLDIGGGDYQRTYDLYDIWDIERVYASHGKIYGSIEPSKHDALSHNRELYQHTSPPRYKGWSELTTKDYVHIINDGLDYSHSMFGVIPPRPFWDDFTKWAKENYPIIFSEECKKLGLNIK